MKPWIFARHAVVAGIVAVLVSWLAISGHAQQGPPMPRGPQFGDVIPGFLRDQLELSPDQARQLKALEAEVRERLAKVLTQQQVEALKNVPPPPEFVGPGGRMPTPRNRTPVDTTPEPTPGPALLLGGSLRADTKTQGESWFRLSGAVAEGPLGDHRQEVSGRGFKFDSAPSPNPEKPSAGSASVMITSLNPAAGRWLEVRVQALVQEGFKVNKGNVYLRLDYFKDGGTNALDFVKKSIDSQVENYRKDLIDDGANESVGNVSWHNYSIQVRLPMPEIDSIRVSIGFGDGAGDAGKSELWVRRLEIRPIPDPEGYMPPSKPASDKNPPVLASLVKIAGNWYYDPRGGARKVPDQFDQTNSDRLLLMTDRLEAPFANNTTAWLRKGYYDIDGNVVTRERFVPDSVLIHFTDNHLVLKAKNLPNHPTAVFPDRSRFLDGNPGAIGEQNNTWYIPINPRLNPNPQSMKPGNGRALPMGPIGVAVNGVVFYNPFDAEITDAIWRMDRCCGHPGPNSTYHYHKYPSCVNTPWDDDGTSHSPLIGFAFDGFGVYGPYEASRELAKDSRSNPLSDFNLHTDKARGPHYHVTPGKFPHIIGGYWGVMEAKNRPGRRPPPAG
ncbi:MAG: YHYH protein [Planctomycetota bacterium]